MGRWLMQKWGGGYINLSTKEKEVYRVTKGHEGVVIHFLPSATARRSTSAKPLSAPKGEVASSIHS